MSENSIIFELISKEIKEGSHEEVLRLCNKCNNYLDAHDLAGDEDHAKVLAIANIHLGHYQEAWDLFSAIEGFEFEKAYLRYKMGQFQSCLSLCERSPSKAFMVMKAQTVIYIQLYRLSQYEAATSEYEQLLKSDQETDYLINLSACLASPGLYERSLGHALLQHPSEWEAMFNISCAAAELQSYPDAQRLLEQAQKIIAKSPDLESELGLIQAQTGYIHLKMDETDQAKAIFQKLETNLDKNISTIAKNNLLVINASENIDAIKTVKQALSEENKLSSNQRLNLLLNYALLTGKRRKFKDYELAIEECQQINPSDPRLIKIKAFILSKERKHNEYTELLRSVEQGWAYLLLSKLYLQHNKTQEAIEAVALAKQYGASIESRDYYLTLSNVLIKNGDVQENLALLEEGATKLQDRQILLAWADSLMRNKETERALEVLIAHHKPDLIPHIVFVATLAGRTDIAEEWSKKLPQVNLKDLYSADKVMSLDEILDSLEFAAVAAKKAEEKKASEFAPKKRKRKPKYPKDFDPSNPGKGPDPERWLPKKMRSDFLKKFKKKKNMKMKGTQGAYNPDLAGQERSNLNKGPSTAHREAVGETRKKRKR